MKCCWCRKIVDHYICPKCRKGFKAVCPLCHLKTRHGAPRPKNEEFLFDLKPKPLFGRADPNHEFWEYEAGPWQQNAIRILEDG